MSEFNKMFFLHYIETGYFIFFFSKRQKLEAGGAQLNFMNLL